MGETILSRITLLFHDAAVIWAPTIGGIMHDVLVQLIVIGWFFLLVSECVVPSVGMFFPIMLFLVGQGFALAMVDQGYIWIEDVFNGVKQIGFQLGAAIDPSATASLGTYVAYPIMKSLADQGALSYFLSPATYIYGLAGHAFHLAFLALAFMEMGTLILSYVLIAATPFFFAFAGTEWTRPMTMTFVRLVFGCLGSLFAILLIKCQSLEMGELLQIELRNHFLTPGITNTIEDYAVAGGIALVLLAVFIWLPIYIGRAAYGAVPSWSGARVVAGYAGAAVSMAGGAAMSIGGSLSNYVGGSGGGGGGQLAPAGAGAGGGSGSGGLPQSAPPSQWGGRP